MRINHKEDAAYAKRRRRSVRYIQNKAEKGAYSMIKYAIKRIILLIPTLAVVLALVFCLMRLVPGSPVYAMIEGEDYTPEEIYQLEEELGFHDPI